MRTQRTTTFILFFVFSLSFINPASGVTDKDLTHLKELMMTKIDNITVATELARLSMEKRLDSMNEFRETLKDQAGRFATKEEINSLNNDIRELRESKAKLEGKADQSSVTITLGISIVSLLVGVLGIVKNWAKDKRE